MGRVFQPTGLTGGLDSAHSRFRRRSVGRLRTTISVVHHRIVGRASFGPARPCSGYPAVSVPLPRGATLVRHEAPKPRAGAHKGALQVCLSLCFPLSLSLLVVHGVDGRLSLDVLQCRPERRYVLARSDAPSIAPVGALAGILGCPVLRWCWHGHPPAWSNTTR